MRGFKIIMTIIIMSFISSRYLLQDLVSPLFIYVVTDLFFGEARAQKTSKDADFTNSASSGGKGGARGGTTSKMQLSARGAPSERPTSPPPGAQRRSQDHILPKRQPGRLYLDNKTLLRIFRMSFLESATVITAGDQSKPSFIILFIKTNREKWEGLRFLSSLLAL